MSSAIIRLKPEELQTPLIAWPTVGLAFAGVTLWGYSFFRIVLLGDHSVFWVTVSSLSAFACFTPAHDAAHFAVGRRTAIARVVNDVTGRLCGIPLLSPFCLFRHVHLLHHKYTNNPKLDPDFYTQGGFFCCLFVELHYYKYVWEYFDCVPKSIFWEGVLNLCFVWGCLVTLICIFGFVPVGLGALLPQRLAVLWLAYTFDRVPHRGALERSVDPYRTTKRITGFFAENVPSIVPSNVSELLLRIVIVEQDAHVVHHLFPTIPFYAYHAVWNNHKKEFYKAGVEKTTLFSM